jgi:hypothetical protein
MEGADRPSTREGPPRSLTPGLHESSHIGSKPCTHRLRRHSHHGSTWIHTSAPHSFTRGLHGTGRRRDGGRGSGIRRQSQFHLHAQSHLGSTGQGVRSRPWRARRGVLPPDQGHAARPVALETTETSLAALCRALASFLHFSSEVGIGIVLARCLASAGATASGARWRWEAPVAGPVRWGHLWERRRGWPLPRTGVGFVADFHLLWMRGPWGSSWRIQSRPARACWHQRSNGVESPPPGFHRVMTWQARHRIALVGEL